MQLAGEGYKLWQSGGKVSRKMRGGIW